MAEEPKEPMATLYVRGQPPREVPVSESGAIIKDAMQKVLGKKARGRAVGQAQRDIEEDTGVAPKQKEREAVAEGIAADRLRSIVERVERLAEEKKALSSDISDIFAEAKGAGFDVKALRQIIKMRTWEPAALEGHETLVDLYRRALGM